MAILLRSATIALAYGHWARLAWRSCGNNPWGNREQTRVQKLGEYGACRSPEGLARESSVNSGLKVILASTGQTGTTSVTQALRDLGFSVYHIEEKAALAMPLMWGEPDINASVVARVCSRCGIDAISLEPSFDTLPLFLEASPPDVKVISTWRQYPSWSKSADPDGLWGIPSIWANRDIRCNYLKMGLFSGHLLVPWLDLWDAMFGTFTNFANAGKQFAGAGEASITGYIFNMAQLGYSHPRNQHTKRGSYKVNGQEEAFLAHYDEIRRRVSPERLLEFDVKKHSWKELADFMGVPERAAPYLGTKFPHPRVGAKSWTNDQLYDNAPDKAVPALFLLGIGHLLNAILISAWLSQFRVLVSGVLGGKGGLAVHAVRATLLVASVLLVAARFRRIVMGPLGFSYDHPTHMVAGHADL